MPYRRLVIGSLLLIAGCGTFGSSTLTQAPQDWSKYEGNTVTVRGDSGNSRLGPIVRLQEGGYIALYTRTPWGIDEVGKRVEVTGKVINANGFRAEAFALDVKSAKLLPPEPTPEPDAAPEPEPDAPAKKASK